MITEQTETPAGFKIFHPTLKTEVVLPEKIGEGESAIETKGLIEAIIGKSRAEHRGELTRKIQEYETRLGDYEETKRQLEELETANMTAAQKAQRDAERTANETKKWQTQAQELQNALHSERLDNALYKMVGSNPEIFNADQTMKLFKAEASPRLIDDNGNLKPVAVLDGQELDMSEAFKKWIAKETNANLLKNKLTPGGGSNGGQRQTAKNSMSKADFDALPANERFAFINGGGKLTA